ncbi:ATP-grasp domain-containing protein [Herbiconiux sp. A18JL235]|uniref:ATP-grasp domain-containing protein n=1 Tax=Herbiconiux sp. A18JL235 TaxID=3152363 RepID=A0AB39BL02_9MICO
MSASVADTGVPGRRVLVTGSRAPVALDLARLFAADGATVFTADSEPALASRSRAVTRAYRVPSARFRPEEYRAAVAGIVSRHGVDLVVPTCEEVFWLAAGGGAGGAGEGGEGPAAVLGRALFAPDPPTLTRLHDKAAFVTLVGTLGLRAPETEVVTTGIAWRRRSAARGAGAPELIAKPAFSRFGTRVMRIGRGEPLPTLGGLHPHAPWLLQERVLGEELCVSAIAVAGRLTAFVAYRPAWRLGAGAGVAFERLDHRTGAAAEAFAAASRLAAALDLTGQFGLDLIAAPEGVTLLECNPRATSGVHLFTPADGLPRAFELTDRTRSRDGLVTASRRAARLGLPHLMAAGSIRNRRDAATFLGLLRAPDALVTRHDGVGTPALLRSLAVQLRTAVTRGVPLTAASTHDLEWNGPGARGSGRDPGWGARLVEEVGRSGGLASLAPNLAGEMTSVRVSGESVPVTVPPPLPPSPVSPPQPPADRGPADRRPADRGPAEGLSYVIAPRTHFIGYAREELGELDSRTLRAVAGAVIAVLDRLVAPARLDRTVIVGNGVVSTNLLPELDERELRTLTEALAREHPDSAIAWRSVHGRRSTNPEVLRRAGYRLIPSRSVLFTPTTTGEWERLRDAARDRAVFERSGYREVDAPLDPATGASPLELRERIAELYGLLYVEKYSALNPRYTAEFVAAAQRAGFLRFVLLQRADGSVDGVFGYSVAHGYLAAPVFGYDTALPQRLGLYRMLSLQVARRAHAAGVELHNSSGVAAFKRHRGAEPEIEYTAVFTRHLPWPRRLGWAALEHVVRGIAVPLVTRAGL